MPYKTHKISKSIKSALLSIAAMLVASCATHSPNTTPIHITIKTPSIRLSDTGFLYDTRYGKSLEVYKLTQKILTIKLNDNTTCLNGTCYAKNDFNKHFFGANYYDDMLDDLLRFDAIFNKSHMREQDGCMIQDIKDIHYQRCTDFIYFKDNKYHNVIKLKILR